MAVRSNPVNDPMQQMFSGIREQISPTILAVATVLVLLSILLLTLLEALRRRNERLRGMSPGSNESFHLPRPHVSPDQSSKTSAERHPSMESKGGTSRGVESTRFGRDGVADLIFSRAQVNQGQNGMNQ